MECLLLSLVGCHLGNGYLYPCLHISHSIEDLNEALLLLQIVSQTSITTIVPRNKHRSLLHRACRSDIVKPKWCSIASLITQILSCSFGKKIRKESLLWFCMRDGATMTLHLPDSKITEHSSFVLLSAHELGTQEDARPRQLTIQAATLSYQSFQCHHNVSYVKPSRGFFPNFSPKLWDKIWDEMTGYKAILHIAISTYRYIAHHQCVNDDPPGREKTVMTHWAGM